MSNFYAISDTHFGHANIVKACSEWTDKEKCRDFQSIEEHDDYLINEINKKVRACDTLYHCGDFGFGFNKAERFKEIRNKIKCESIYLSRGNHDNCLQRKSKYYEELAPLFRDIRDIYYGSFNKQKIVMCHYAMRTFPWQQHGAWMLYGHSHSSLPDDPNSLSLDVGVDTCLYGHEKYTPYSFDELRHIMTNHKTLTKIDHHGKDTPT